MTTANGTHVSNGVNGSATSSPPESLTNYIAYSDPTRNNLPRIGHLNQEDSSITPLSFASGTPLTSLYQVISIGASNITAAGTPIARSSVIVLPPISGRDILCVGKNYSAHAKEFNTSGYDSSDKVDQPTHPVIFTKRATSIIADGEPMYPHPEFTETVDYEGEIGVIVGKPGFRIKEENAMDYVWGYTIINDMTARERQRNHKQFYIGKSPDTFCPMGPIAVPASKLDKVLRVQTHVNGEKKQDATTEDLIFSIPFLIMTLSEGQTLQPGDVLASGTPAGVGIGKSPPVFLKPGDTISVSINGLGSITNKIASPSTLNPTVSRVHAESAAHIPWTNTAKSVDSNAALTTINSKPLYYATQGTPLSPPIVFVHGLGGTSEFFSPLIASLPPSITDSSSFHRFDLEGHGLSPTSALSTLSISSFASDLSGVFTHASITSGATLIAHSMGCLVALDFAITHPDLLSNLILLGPPPAPLPSAASSGAHARATTARTKGMSAVVDAVVSAGTSKHTQESNPLAVAAVRLSLLGQDPEGYAKACSALAGATGKLEIEKVTARTLIITGDEDKVSSPDMCSGMAERMEKCEVVILKDVGHWLVFEDVVGVSGAVGKFLKHS